MFVILSTFIQGLLTLLREKGSVASGVWWDLRPEHLCSLLCTPGTANTGAEASGGWEFPEIVREDVFGLEGSGGVSHSDRDSA